MNADAVWETEIGPGSLFTLVFYINRITFQITVSQVLIVISLDARKNNLSP